MSDIEFHLEDFSARSISQIESAANKFLEESASEIESAAKRNTRVDTGNTKSSFKHKVANKEAFIGSDNINAVYEEYGTGIYAEKGDGRKTPWFYQDARGQFHRTQGKRGTRVLRRAFDDNSSKIREIAAKTFKEMK